MKSLYSFKHYKKLVIIPLLFSTLLPLNALKKEYQTIEDTYQAGNFEEASKQLILLKPATPDEKAFFAYYKAKLETDTDQQIKQLENVTVSHTRQFYGQKAMLDLAEYHFIARHYDESLEWLNKITDPNIIEKSFWQARAYLKLNQYEKALSNADLFLKLSTDPYSNELIAYTQIEAYMQTKKFYSAQVVISKLLQGNQTIQNLPYLYYKQGYCYEMSGNSDKAIESYKQIFSTDRYSQYAYMAEERVYAIKRANSRLDVSFLYPLPKSKQEVIDNIAPKDSTVTSTVTLPKDKQEVALILPATEKLPLEVGPKENGFFVQIGRFASEDNARKQIDIIAKEGFVRGRVLKKKEKGSQHYLVVFGPFKENNQALQLREQLKQRAYASFIIEL